MLKEIGNDLRRTREARGLSLRDVQAETKIRLRYLEALEDGDFSVIPGEVYAKGFLRSYAQLLGLDSEEIMARYRQSVSSVGQDSEVAVTLAVNPLNEPLPRVTRLRKSSGWAVPFLVTALLIVLGGALGLYYFGFSLVGSKPASDGPPVDQSRPAAAEPKADRPQPSSPQVNPPAGNSPPNQSRRQSQAQVIALPVDPYKPFLLGFEILDPTQAPLRLEIKTGVRCWYEVTADGHVIATGILEAGGTSSWEARDRFSVRLGDPRQLEVSINGGRLPVNNYNEPVTFEAVRKR